MLWDAEVICREGDIPGTAVPLASHCPQIVTALSSWGHLDFPQSLLGLFLGGGHSPNSSKGRGRSLRPHRVPQDTTVQFQGVRLKLSEVKGQSWINAFLKRYQNAFLEKRPSWSWYKTAVTTSKHLLRVSMLIS